MKHWTAALVALPLAISACSKGGDAAPSEPLGFDETVAADVLARYPAPEGSSIVSWLLDGDLSRTAELTRLSNEYTFECMQAAGFTSYPLRNPPPASETNLATVLTPLPADQAASLGYTSPTATEEQAWVDPVKGFYDSLSPDQQQAFVSSNEACAVSERDVIFNGQFEAYDTVRVDLQDKMLGLFNTFYASPQFQEVTEDWSECMKAAGYDFATPTAAADDMLAQGDKRAEIRVAQADAACRGQFGTEERVDDLFRLAEANFIAANERLIVEVMNLSMRNVPNS